MATRLVEGLKKGQDWHFIVVTPFVFLGLRAIAVSVGRAIAFWFD